MDRGVYGDCGRCGCKLVPVWFTDEEIIYENGRQIKTGRTRRAVNFLMCPRCLSKETVDDTFDEPWR